MSQQVQDMFARIARRYDRANTVLSFGQDRRWRRVAVRMADVRPGDAVLDVACGTGALTRALARRVGSDGNVVGVDFTQAMLDIAQQRPSRGAATTYQWADAQDLPFDDGAFDAATIAFGIRNVDDPARGIAEMARVVRPGGQVVALEFGQPSGIMGAVYKVHSRHVMPRVGGLLTGDRAAYEYLPRTAAAFPAGEAFVALMRDAAPFEAIQKRSIMGGMVWCYAGRVA